MGREITRQEAERILRNCEESGLVHAISNYQGKPDTICNCCKCCCMWFEAHYKLHHPMSMSPSNYKAHANESTCVGCGLCVKRCPMEAIQFIERPDIKGRRTTVVKDGKGSREITNKLGKVAEVHSERCIGCGVCAYKCPTESLLLKQVESIEEPPKTVRDWAMLFMADRHNQ